MPEAAAAQLQAFNFASPQSEQNATPQRLAQALTIKPLTKMVFLTGAVQIKWIGTLIPVSIDPAIPEHAEPVQEGYHELVLVPDTGSTLLTTGNIGNAVILTADVPNMLFYDPVTKKYYGFAGNLT